MSLIRLAVGLIAAFLIILMALLLAYTAACGLIRSLRSGHLRYWYRLAVCKVTHGRLMPGRKPPEGGPMSSGRRLSVRERGVLADVAAAQQKKRTAFHMDPMRQRGRSK